MDRRYSHYIGRSLNRFEPGKRYWLTHSSLFIHLLTHWLTHSSVFIHLRTHFVGLRRWISINSVARSSWRQWRGRRRRGLTRELSPRHWCGWPSARNPKVSWIYVSRTTRWLDYIVHIVSSVITKPALTHLKLIIYKNNSVQIYWTSIVRAMRIGISVLVSTSDHAATLIVSPRDIDLFAVTMICIPSPLCMCSLACSFTRTQSASPIPSSWLITLCLVAVVVVDVLAQAHLRVTQEFVLGVIRLEDTVQLGLFVDIAHKCPCIETIFTRFNLLQ